MQFEIGQVVTWPAAPNHLAQIDELRRTHVRLFYRCGTGLIRRPIIAANLLSTVQTREQPPLPLFNLFDRGILRRPAHSRRKNRAILN